MRILHISTYDNKGGASVGCLRLHEALVRQGVDSTVLVMDSVTKVDRIHSTTSSKFKKLLNLCRLIWEKLDFHFHQKSASVRFQFSTAIAGEDISSHPLVKEASILNIHWVNHSFISLKGLQKLLSLGKPVVWTFHDMWAFTGGCHHSYECEGYIDSCGNCPYLKNPGEEDISHQHWKKKLEIYNKGKFIYVCVGTWLHDRAGKSSLLKGMKSKVIPNTIDANSFVPKNRQYSRKIFGLPENAKVILFGSLRLDDPIKGWNYLIEALDMVIERKPEWESELHLVLFGRRIKDPALLNNIPIGYSIINSLNDAEKIAALYSASDITVIPSLYETFSLVAIESLSCGTPVVAFNHSGPKDIVDHKKNGYLAEYKSAKDLGNGIIWIFDAEVAEKNCREKVIREFDYPVVAEKYAHLYKSLPG